MMKKTLFFAAVIALAGPADVDGIAISLERRCACRPPAHGQKETSVA
jgi:hypothetical protein